MQKEKQLVPKLRFPEFDKYWGIIRLGEICKIQTGNKDTQDKEENGLYPFYVRSNTIERINSYSLDEEAILTSGDGAGVGKIYHLVNGKFNLHQRVYALTNFKTDFSIEYTYHFFSEKFYKRVIRLSAKNSVDSVRRDMIFDMKMPHPKLKEQQKIANFLTSIDHRIQTLEQKKTLLEHYKKGVMQKIFKQELRFKDDSGDAFPEWEVKKLGEVCEKKSSNISANKIEDNFGEYLIYGASGILKKVDFYEEENDYVSIIKDGAGVGRIVYCKGKSSVLGTMEIIKSNSNVNTYFLYCLLENINFKKYITGSTIPHIYFKDYKKENIKIPSLPEQTKIANFLSAIDENIALVNTKIEHTKAYKKGLLQQMFV